MKTERLDETLTDLVLRLLHFCSGHLRRSISVDLFRICLAKSERKNELRKAEHLDETLTGLALRLM